MFTQITDPWKEYKQHAARGYCTGCDEWPAHACVFCGLEKTTARCLLPCRFRHARNDIFGHIQLLLNPWHQLSPWKKLRREINSLIGR